MTARTLPCSHCDPLGVVWTFKRGEHPSEPEDGQWRECEHCDGTGRVPDPDFELEDEDERP